MYCIKSHIHFQVSPSTSEIFNKNLKIGRFLPRFTLLVSGVDRAFPEVAHPEGQNEEENEFEEK